MPEKSLRINHRHQCNPLGTCQKIRKKNKLTSGFFPVWKRMMLAVATALLLAGPTRAQGLPEGRYTERYENNRIKTEGRYKNGQKTGNWIYYSPEGLLQKRERWRRGQLRLTFTYTDKGRLASITDDKGRTTKKADCGCP